MHVQLLLRDAGCQVALGDTDPASGPELLRHVTALADAGPGDVRVDVGVLAHAPVSSFWLVVLLACARRVRRAGSRLVVVGAPEALAATLARVGIAVQTDVSAAPPGRRR